MAIGWPPKTRCMSDGGRVSQSLACLSTPGIALLYSGVASSSAWAAAMASLRSCTGLGMPDCFSSSPLSSGIASIALMTTSTPDSALLAASRSSAELNEPRTLITVDRRSTAGDMGTRGIQKARLFSHDGLGNGEEPCLSQFLRTTNDDKLSDHYLSFATGGPRAVQKLPGYPPSRC